MRVGIHAEHDTMGFGDFDVIRTPAKNEGRLVTRVHDAQRSCCGVEFAAHERDERIAVDILRDDRIGMFDQQREIGGPQRRHESAHEVAQHEGVECRGERLARSVA